MENILEEQPKNQENVAPVVEEPNKEVKEKVSDEQNLESMGSSTKKFKSVEALTLAYENLEKEFTKKCQMLSALQAKQVCDNNSEELLPQYEKSDWFDKVTSFLNENELAKNYTKEISEVLINDSGIAKDKNALKLAFFEVLKKNYKTEKDLIESEDFLKDYVYSNEKIKTTIIENYLNNLSLNKTIPLISNVNGTNGLLAGKYKPKSIADAGRVAENIFKK